MKSYWRSEKSQISQGDQQAYYLQVPDVFQIFLDIAATDETIHKLRDQDSFRNKLKNSVHIYESSGLQFCRTTTGTQRKPETPE